MEQTTGENGEDEINEGEAAIYSRLETMRGLDAGTRMLDLSRCRLSVIPADTLRLTSLTVGPLLGYSCRCRGIAISAIRICFFQVSDRLGTISPG